ncbi:MAG: phage Gp37/Gp68 family protein [Phycisphaerae bacterium]|nr:phage Gp37/Gp68 family protein [Phycisphaerae bacterium]
MSKTKIEWTDSSWNPVTGCTPVSEGCANCYAKRMAKRLQGMGTPGYENGFAVTLHPDRLDQPLRWKKPRMIFVCSMGDLFHDDVPFEFIERIIAVAAICPRHIFQILTKRPARMRKFIRWYVPRNKNYLFDPERVAPDYRYAANVPVQDATWPLPNVWLGVTVESPECYERIAHLKNTPAVMRFVSIEPMLAGIKLTEDTLRMLDWVIVGGETGPGARPMDPAWARGVRDQCVAANVPFFFKQWGAWIHDSQIPKAMIRALPLGDCITEHPWITHIHEWPDGTCSFRIGKKKAGRLHAGREWNEMPLQTGTGD